MSTFSITMHAICAASFFIGFSADESAAVRLGGGARGGFKDCTLNLNTANAYGACIGMGESAASWLQSCTMSTNTDLATQTVPEASPIAQGDGSLYFNNKDFQHSVSVRGERLDPRPVTVESLAETGFLVSQAEVYQQISQVRLFRLCHICLLPLSM